MLVKVFLLGRPGSGKSYIAQCIRKFAENNGWFVHHAYDYEILQTMFLEEESRNTAPELRKFSRKGPESHHGFDVIDFSVLDTALERMAVKIGLEVDKKQTSPGDKLFLIEFARKDYISALHKFNDHLQNAHLFYIHADIETCVERVHRRVKRGSPYGHFVSEDIIRAYYQKDDWIDGRLQKHIRDLRIRDIHVSTKEIDNRGSIQQLIQRVKEAVEEYFLKETEDLPVVSKLVSQTESSE